MTVQNNVNPQSPQPYEVVIVGAGISGIGAAIRLLKDGFENFVILEKADDLGGTWRDNTYPGCECDVPSALYSYSFAQNPDWSVAFAGQAEILEYIRRTASEYNVEQYIRFNQPVERAKWDERAGLWNLDSAGSQCQARKVITCSGYLHEPVVPNVPGLDEFSGELFHSARWNHDYDLRGKRVAVIGTGASAIQFIPAIQPQVAQMHVFQRSPQWVLPKPNHPVPEVEKMLLRRKPILSTWRKMLFGGFESFGVGFRRPALLRHVQKVANAHLKVAIKDKDLREKLTPDYTLGCKRVLMSNQYYPALTQSNVELHAAGVKAIRGNVVIGTDGSEAEVDCIILGTGFSVTEQPITARVFDHEGRSLREHWSARMEAYKGTTIKGFPNAFMVLGPNLGIGHNSAFIVIEAQLDYIMSALNAMRAENLRRIEVKSSAQASYNQKVQQALQSTVWNTGGCSSYYLDKQGFNSIGFPWSTLRMQKLLKTFDASNYHLQQEELAELASKVA